MAEETSISSPSRVLIPKSQPISILQNDTARLYRHVHPALILSLFYLSFSRLVADPVTTLTRAITPIAILQLLYCLICLPQTLGRPVPPPSTPLKTPKRKKVQFAKPPPTIWSKIIPAVLSLLLTFSLAIPLTTVLLICHGAPLTTHFFHNVLCATHIALLGVIPLFYVHGVDSRIWREVSAAALPFDEVWGGAIGAIVGAWFGAVPIPLDWDREWQKWPVTIVTGVYLGWAVGRLGGEWLLKGKRIDFTEKDEVKKP